MSVPGGPGWLTDIFESHFVFEERSYTSIDDVWSLRRGARKPAQIKCFDGKGAISGKLFVAAPEGRTIGHNGIEITFKTYVHSAEVDAIEVVKKTWTLLEAGEIDGAVEISFDIDLLEIQSLRDTFDGEHLSLRHCLTYRIVRPWYTFSVRGEEPIAIANASIPDNMPAEPKESILKIEDFGGGCYLDHGKCTFTTDDTLVGTVAFGAMGADTMPIGKVELIVGRSEQMAKEFRDSIVRRHVLHSGEAGWVSSDMAMDVEVELAASAADAPMEAEAEDTGHFEGKLPPSMAPSARPRRSNAAAPEPFGSRGRPRAARTLAEAALISKVRPLSRGRSRARRPRDRPAQRRLGRVLGAAAADRGRRAGARGRGRQEAQAAAQRVLDDAPHPPAARQQRRLSGRGARDGSAWPPPRERARLL